MKIENAHNVIQLEELERNSEGSPCAGDVNLSIAIRLQDFQGSYSGVWLELSVMQTFLRELEMLEASKKGAAKIRSISPDEFVLMIRSSDRVSYMEMAVQLQMPSYCGGQYRPIQLKGSFEVHIDAIRNLIAYFKTLTTPIL